MFDGSIKLYIVKVHNIIKFILHYILKLKTIIIITPDRNEIIL